MKMVSAKVMPNPEVDIPANEMMQEWGCNDEADADHIPSTILTCKPKHYWVTNPYPQIGLWSATLLLKFTQKSTSLYRFNSS